MIRESEERTGRGRGKGKREGGKKREREREGGRKEQGSLKECKKGNDDNDNNSISCRRSTSITDMLCARAKYVRLLDCHCSSPP